MNFGANFIVEYRRQEFGGDYFRIVVIEDEKRIKKSKWFSDNDIAHLKFRKQNYYAFSDWHKGWKKDRSTAFPVDQVISFIEHPSSIRNQTEQETAREFRRMWFSREKRNNKKK